MKLPENLQGQFELLELIHETASTEIWRVEEISTKKIFVLRETCRTNLAYKEIANVKHKNLPKIFSVTETDFATYVVEEFLSGESLAHQLEKHGAFSEEEVCKIALEICSCLEKLHERHIIHRDIKPENIFLTSDGSYKLIDFDAARIEKVGVFADTNFLGTPGYAAPEQYGFQQTDERTDIYSLGLTLKKLAGYEDYSGFLTPIFNKCASFDPDKRYNSAKDLRNAIIRSQRLHKWRKILVAGIAILAIYFFVTKPVPVENVPAENLPPVETSSDLPTIMYPEEENQNLGVYEPYTPPSISEVKKSVTETPDFDTDKTVTENSNFDVDKIVAETSEKVDALNLESSPKMPFRDFKNQMRNLNLSDEELAEKYDEHNRRLEVNQRLREFEELLPEDLSAEEKNAAIMKFNEQQ